MHPSVRLAFNPTGTDSPSDWVQESEALFDSLLTEFQRIASINFSLPSDLKAQSLNFLEQIDHSKILAPSIRRARLISHINKKLRVNKDATAITYKVAASRGVTFNHREKRAIEQAFDGNDVEGYHQIIAEKVSSESAALAILATFKPASEADTFAVFHRECAQTTNPRIKRVDASMTTTMLEAIFAAYLFSSFPIEIVHQVFDPLPAGTAYEPDFWRRLHLHSAHLFDRENALWIGSLNQSALFEAGSYNALRDRLCGFVKEAYARIDNHGFLAIYIEPLVDDRHHVTWELAADLTLLAEKFVEEEISGNFFQKDRIRKTTADYIKNIDIVAAKFEIANLGFSYQDCFVLYPDKENEEVMPSLLLLFQKHRRDETPIPCPACRSHKVQGNSYPKLGVRSWECQNYVCSDRSKSNRG